MATQTLPPSVATWIQNLNSEIRVLAQERDRVLQLLDTSLAAGVSVWGLLDVNTQTTIKNDMIANMTAARDALNTTITQLSSF